jgi:hypothetical protein
MTLLLPLDCPIAWTPAHERSLKRDYPLAVDLNASLQERVVRVYLEYLWLPEVCHV